MAQKTHINIIDDLDGTPDAAFPNTQFSLDGIQYEIDLSEGNKERLNEALEEYIAAARRTGGRRKVPAAAVAQNAAEPARDWEQVRAWGRENGFTISPRGRLPRAVVDAYEAREQKAAAKPDKPEKPRRKRGTAAVAKAAFSA